MATYVVLSAKSGPDKDPDAIFVRDGFSLAAAIFPLLWLLWHRMWAWAILLLVVVVGTGLAADFPSTEILAGGVMFGISLLTGFEGRHWYVQSLIRRGYSVRSILEATSLETAEAAYFDSAPMVFKRLHANAKPAVSNNMQGVGLFDSYGGI